MPPSSNWDIVHQCFIDEFTKLATESSDEKLTDKLLVEETQRLVLGFGRTSKPFDDHEHTVPVTHRPVGMTFQAESFPFIVEEITDGSELHNGNIQKGMELVRYRWETKRGDGEWQPAPWVDMPTSGNWQDAFKSFTYELAKLPGHDASYYNHPILHLVFGENSKDVQTVLVTRKPVGMTFKADSFPFIVEEITEGSELHNGNIRQGMQLLRYRWENKRGNKSQLHPWVRMPLSGNWDQACTRFTDELEKLPDEPLVERKRRILATFCGDANEVKTVYVTQWPCGATFQNGNFPFIVEHIAEGCELDRGGIKPGMQFLSYQPEVLRGNEEWEQWQLQPRVDMPLSSNWDIVHSRVLHDLVRLPAESSGRKLVGRLLVEEKQRLVLAFGSIGNGNGQGNYVSAVPVTQRPVGMTFKVESFPFIVEEITEGSELYSNGIQSGMQFLCYRWETQGADGQWRPQPWVNLPHSGIWQAAFKSFTFELTKLPLHPSGYTQSTLHFPPGPLDYTHCILHLAFGGNSKDVQTVLVTRKPVGMTFKADSFPFIVEEITEGSELHNGNIRQGMQLLRYRWENKRGSESQLRPWVDMPLSGNWQLSFEGFVAELEKLPGEQLEADKRRLVLEFEGDGTKAVHVTHKPVGIIFKVDHFPFSIERVEPGSELQQAGIETHMQLMRYRWETARSDGEWHVKPWVDMPLLGNWHHSFTMFTNELQKLPGEAAHQTLTM
eukprot:TRINITY_DN10942_c0_g1_i1.p1 TRINITY_DN10942_c0_g1~~TRINITY_DN10942_c0_g1_i1.p1  ORF type:complete len:849 (-),score=118.33 TRINITY_DN10942_c0_g1_i1:370-2538(-)